MPGPVRAAQVLFFVMAGLFVLASVLAGDAEAAGRIFAVNLPVILGFVSALRFPKRKRNTRGTAVLLAWLMILFGLGALGQHQPAGLVEFAAGVAIVVLLGQRPSRLWFGGPVRS